MTSAKDTGIHLVSRDKTQLHPISFYPVLGKIDRWTTNEKHLLFYCVSNIKSMAFNETYGYETWGLETCDCDTWD